MPPRRSSFPLPPARGCMARAALVAATCLFSFGRLASAQDALADPGFAASTGLHTVHAVAMQSDGKILIGGEFTEVNGIGRFGLARLLPSGALDTTFTAGPTGIGRTIRSIAVLSNDQIVVAGDFNQFNGVARSRIVRLQANGTLDASFTSAVQFGYPQKVALDGLGRLVVAGEIGNGEGGALLRLTTTGAHDGTFPPMPGSAVYDFAIEPSGSIVFGGAFTQVGTTPRNRLARVSDAGVLDASFNPNAGGTIDAVALLADGRIAAGGIFSFMGGRPVNHLALLESTGEVVAGFSPLFNAGVTAVAQQSDGKLLVGGAFSMMGALTRSTLVRLNLDGTIDDTFIAPPWGANNSIRAIVVQPDLKVLVGGHFGQAPARPQRNIGRMLPRLPTLDPPTAFAVTAVVGNTLYLQWLAPQGGLTPTGYLLEGGVMPGQTLASIPTGGTATTFSVNAPTGVFYLRMISTTGNARSGPSNEIRVAVNVLEPPMPPTALLGMVNGSQLTLSWTPPATGGATGYLLTVTGSAAVALAIPNAESFPFSGVPPGIYTLALSAQNSEGTSGPSNSVTLSFPQACTGVPRAPAQFSVSRAGNTLAVSWQPPTSGPAVSGYVLRVSGPISGAIALATRSIAGAVPPGTYSLTVGATNGCGAGVATAPQAVTVP